MQNDERWYVRRASGGAVRGVCGPWNARRPRTSSHRPTTRPLGGPGRSAPCLGVCRPHGPRIRGVMPQPMHTGRLPGTGPESEGGRGAQEAMGPEGPSPRQCPTGPEEALLTSEWDVGRTPPPPRPHSRGGGGGALNRGRRAPEAATSAPTL